MQDLSDDLTPQLGGELDALTNKIINLGTPTASTDATTKAYVDAAINTGVGNIDAAFIETPQTMTTSKVVAANTNAGMMGPTVALNTGVTLTVGTNSVLTTLA